MATKLQLYNKALIKVGETVLATIVDDRPSRYSLDAVWDLNAVNRCLEAVKPRFAATTIASTGLASAVVSLAFEHTLPADYVTIVGVYSDAELDQEVSRYIEDGGSVFSDYQTLYIRYINSSVTEADFTPGFADVVSLYLAREISYQFDVERFEGIDAELQKTIENVINIEAMKEPLYRPATEAGSFSEDWRKVYNGALIILGQEKLPTGNTDHPNRVMIDTVIANGIIDAVMEDTEWQFGIKTVKIEYDVSVEPEWGFRFAHQKPADLHRLAGIFIDEEMTRPLRQYEDESGYYFCAYTEIYVKYVSSDYISQPTSWTDTFRRLVSARIAKDIAPGVVGGLPANKAAGLIAHANQVYKERNQTAQNSNAMQSPPQSIHGGDWIDSRFRYSRYGRGRP
jgi:hypothetical protein